MNTKPTKPARWSDDGISVPGRVEPNEAKKDAGYPNGEEPPAGEHNYLWGHYGDWIQYLEAQHAASLVNFVATSSIGITATKLAQGKLPGAQSSAWVAFGTAPDVSYSYDGRVWAATAYDLGGGGPVGAPVDALHTDVEGDGIAEIGGFYALFGSGTNQLQVSRSGATAFSGANYAAAGGSGTALAVGKVAGEWVVGIAETNDQVAYITTPVLVAAVHNSPGLVEDYYGIAWSSTLNLWVIVGTNGTIVTTPDLASFTQRTAAAGYAGTFGVVRWDDRNLAFIAASDDGEIQRSLDGITWEQIQTATGADFQASRRLRVIRGFCIMAVKEAENVARWGFAYSIDGGATWSKFMHSPWASDVSFRDGFIPDGYGTLLAAPGGAPGTFFVHSAFRMSLE